MQQLVISSLHAGEQAGGSLHVVAEGTLKSAADLRGREEHVQRDRAPQVMFHLLIYQIIMYFLLRGFGL